MMMIIGEAACESVRIMDVWFGWPERVMVKECLWVGRCDKRLLDDVKSEIASSHYVGLCFSYCEIKLELGNGIFVES